MLNVEDPALLEEMREAALEVKKKVYDNRIVFFAPIYCSNPCVNRCVYCGFRSDNSAERRRILTMDEVRRETEAVIDEGHKRVIAVYGEHPLTGADYIAETMRTIYATKRETPSGKGFNAIRRININAAPMCIEDLRKLWRAGIGTFQVFQETYPTTTDVMPNCIPAIPSRAITAGGFTPCTVRWMPASTTWQSAPSSDCTTGALKSWGLWRTRTTWNGSSALVRTPSPSRVCSRR